MTFTNTDILELRKKTGAGIMDCKASLTETNGNQEQAIIILRKKGLAEIKARDHKAASEGLIGHYVHTGGKIGVLVEINCETDFVARGEDFQSFAHDLAMHIAASNPLYKVRDEVPQSVIDREKEIIAPTLLNKPPEIAEKMLTGKLNKVFKEICLMEQVFVKDSNKTISDLLGDLVAKIGEKVVIKKFVRFVIGE